MFRICFAFALLLVFSFSLFRISYAATFVCVLSCTLSFVRLSKLCCNLQDIASKRRISSPQLNVPFVPQAVAVCVASIASTETASFFLRSLSFRYFNFDSVRIAGPSAAWSWVFVSFLTLLLLYALLGLKPFFYCQQFMLCLEFFTLHIFTFFFCFLLDFLCFFITSFCSCLI